MGLDPQYVDAIKGFEGFTPTAQWDYQQNSNGFGTKALYPGETIDKATADQRFQDELGKASDTVDSFAPDAPPGAKAALTSLTYNAGPGWMSSGLGDLVKSGDWQGAAQRLQEYNKAGGQVNPGLVNRRSQEAQWFSADAPQAPGTPQIAQSAPPISGPTPAPIASQPAASSVPAYPFTPGAQAQPASLPVTPGAMPAGLGAAPLPAGLEQGQASPFQQPAPISGPMRRAPDLSQLQAFLQRASAPQSAYRFFKG